MREQAEAQQDALWVEPIDGDVADDEWDQCAEVPEGPSYLVAAYVLPAIRMAGEDICF